MQAQIRHAADQELVTWVGTLADELGKKAEQYDRSGDFLSDQIAYLQSAGYSSLTVPKAYGGRGCDLYQLLLAQERLAHGDPSAALVMGWHLGITLSLSMTEAWPEELYADFCRDVVLGIALVNACGTEPDSGSPSRGGRPATEAVRVEGGYRITGEKTWATGSPAITHFLITAYVAEDDRVGEFLVHKGSEGLHVKKSWDSMSMRASGSDSVVLQDVFVPDAYLLDLVIPGQKTKRSSDGSGWLLHIPATYLGVANAARDYTIDFVKTYVPSSLGKPIATVPHVREKIGQLEAQGAMAETVLWAIARRYDEATMEQKRSMREDLSLAKYIVTNAAVAMVDLAMRTAGGQSILRTHPLERYYRDVRAGLHNPPMDDVTVRQLADRALGK
ncbi:acyl-CoA dehydrogenase family protein [Sulfoacidibacillus ferrooxidans]|uniref:Acyl-CoA dehydrogenase YdbM n=1 Tax=Sulfoacidibacillus ferrooxidans TaxID=2005001 RepID=A0A9X1VB47_9BACL|nr:acyl-CoA dehydrogenase family protein [Sulfoacidibacillus ferrooxidans]MCI0183388.1 putative acyl-CoA dehydrogenase YdbM [Sulfoacidibacillus ferrooxidans]